MGCSQGRMVQPSSPLGTAARDDPSSHPTGAEGCWLLGTSCCALGPSPASLSVTRTPALEEPHAQLSWQLQ